MRFITAGALAALLTAACTVSTSTVGEPSARQPLIEPLPAVTAPVVDGPADPPPSTPTTSPPPEPAVTTGVGQPWGDVSGLTMFRGNPTHTFHGTGPLPETIEVLWRYPDEPLCSNSPLGGTDRIWCGSGWTGQPVVWKRPDGVTEVIFGAYDKNVHFVDAATGEPTRPPFFMGDIIKGSVTLDPNGYQLLYVGSRDSRFRIIALDRDTPTELWSLDANSVAGRWNNDWDSSPLIIDDLLLQGGENSWWFAVKLNRDRDETGLVTIQPEILYQTPTWTEALVRAAGNQHSVESSTAVFGDVAYFATGAGRVIGVDISDLEGGGGRIVFDYWMGDDVDASIVIDEAGMLYVAAEIDLATDRAAEIGQLAKLDPGRPGDPLVWSIPIPGRESIAGGVWATPALYEDTLYVATNPGELLAVATADGTVTWRDEIGAHAWSSPVIVDGMLIVAVDCDNDSGFRAYDLTDPRHPILTWETRVTDGCIESTPAVWGGRIYVGSRDGFFYALGAN